MGRRPHLAWFREQQGEPPPLPGARTPPSPRLLTASGGQNPSGQGYVTAVWDTGKKEKSLAQTSWRPLRRGHLPPWQVHGSRGSGLRAPGEEGRRRLPLLSGQLLSAGALLLASRLLPRSLSTFMVLNLPFFLLSDSASLWKSAAKDKDSQGGREGAPGEDGAVASVTEQGCNHQGLQAIPHQVRSLYAVSPFSLRPTSVRAIWNL